MRWLFFPFAQGFESNDETMPATKQRYRDKYGDDIDILYRGDDLQCVGDGDMLIIAGHGLPGSDKVGVQTRRAVRGQVGAECGTVTANDVADMLVDNHLPRSHIYVKTITCGGAGVGVMNRKAVDNHTHGQVVPLDEWKHTECFASILARALHVRNYGKIRVGGYPGFVRSNRPSGESKALDLMIGRTFKEQCMSTRPGNRHALYHENLVTVSTKLVDQIWFDGKGVVVGKRA